MSSTRTLLIALGLFITVMFTAYTYAYGQEQPPITQPQIEDNKARQVIQDLDRFLKSIPQYELPVILENGDILIRRIHKQSQPEAAGSS